MYAAQPGRTYPELIVRMARGERVEPHVGEYVAGRTFTRYYWQLELDEDLRPTGRDIIEPAGPPSPRRRRRRGDRGDAELAHRAHEVVDLRGCVAPVAGEPTRTR
jgi:hypothetical protein